MRAHPAETRAAAKARGEFTALLNRRWAEMQNALGLAPGRIRLTWELTPDYPHFHTPRGFGVTFHNPGVMACHLAFAPKILAPAYANRKRQDGIIRHELGHVVDFCVSPGSLDRWARRRGVTLPRTPERRADAIAHAVWGKPIRYDRHLMVQTTAQKDTSPRRPTKLGL